MSSGRLESQYPAGSAASSGQFTSSHSSGPGAPRPECAVRTRTRAYREPSQSAEPSRQVTVEKAAAGRPRASALTPTGSRRPS